MHSQLFELVAYARSCLRIYWTSVTGRVDLHVYPPFYLAIIPVQEPSNDKIDHTAHIQGFSKHIERDLLYAISSPTKSRLHHP